MMSALPKHRVIFQSLHEAITTSEYPVGSKIPSEAVLCKKYGASRPTVAHALKELQSMGLVERRPGAGSFVSDRRALEKGNLGLIADGLEATEIIEPVSVEIARSVRIQGWNLLRGSSIRKQDPNRIVKAWKEREVEGVFYAPVEDHLVREAFNRSVVETFRRNGIAVILLDRDILEYPQRSEFDLVSIDDFYAGYELGQHLLNQGDCRILFLAKPEYPATTNFRFVGLESAVKKDPKATLTFCIGNPDNIDFVQKLFRVNQVDAIVCSNDLTAASLLQRLHHLDIKVPSDLRVAGFDDVRYAKLLSPALTTVRQPTEDLAAAAVNAMLTRLENPEIAPRRILIRAQLMVRSSTAKSVQ